MHKLLKPWVKPKYRPPSPRIKLDNGQWARTSDEAAEQWRLQCEATFKGQVTTCTELASSREKRAAGREPCWGIVPLTVDEVLDLILTAATGKAPGEDGSRRRCLGLVKGPWRRSCNPCLQVCVCKEPCLVCGRGWGGIMATIPSGKNTIPRGIMLNDHVGKILERWIRPKILQIEPLLVTRCLLQCMGARSWCMRACLRVQFVYSTCSCVFSLVLWAGLRRHVGLPGFVMDGRPCAKNFVTGSLQLGQGGCSSAPWCRPQRGLPPRRVCRGLPPFLSDAEDASRALLSGVREAHTRELVCTSSWFFQCCVRFFTVLDEGVDLFGVSYCRFILVGPAVFCAHVSVCLLASVAVLFVFHSCVRCLWLLGSKRRDGFVACVLHPRLVMCLLLILRACNPLSFCGG